MSCSKKKYCNPGRKGALILYINIFTATFVTMISILGIIYKFIPLPAAIPLIITGTFFILLQLVGCGYGRYQLWHKIVGRVRNDVFKPRVQGKVAIAAYLKTIGTILFCVAIPAVITALTVAFAILQNTTMVMFAAIPLLLSLCLLVYTFPILAKARQNEQNTIDIYDYPKMTLRLTSKNDSPSTLTVTKDKSLTMEKSGNDYIYKRTGALRVDPDTYSDQCPYDVVYIRDKDGKLLYTLKKDVPLTIEDNGEIKELRLQPAIKPEIPETADTNIDSNVVHGEISVTQNTQQTLTC